MNPDPASNPLVVRRPGDELNEPEIMVAWAAIQRNPSAMAAANAEMRQDEELRAQLREGIVVPADLLDRLSNIPLPSLTDTAPNNVSAMPRRNFSKWLGAAAAVAAGGYFWSRFGTSKENSIEWAHWKQKAILWASAPKLDMQTPQYAEIKTHLTSKNALVPTDVPAALAAGPTIGCQVMEIDGERVSIACFSHKNQAYHLFTANDAHVIGAVGYITQASPTFWSESGWQAASWGNSPQAFMLLTQAAEADLKALFS